MGPLNTKDYLGTLGIFKVYEAFPDVKVTAAPFTVDPGNPDRYWSVIRVEGTHTAPLNVGSALVPATGNKMVVGPQAVSVTFDADDKVKKLTGGYIADGTSLTRALYEFFGSSNAPPPLTRANPRNYSSGWRNWRGRGHVCSHESSRSPNVRPQHGR